MCASLIDFKTGVPRRCLALHPDVNKLIMNKNEEIDYNYNRPVLSETFIYFVTTDNNFLTIHFYSKNIYNAFL